MNNENEMKFIDTNEEPNQPSANQNYSPVPNYSPNDGSSSSKFINTRMVRIRYGTKYSVEECTTAKTFYQINTNLRLITVIHKMKMRALFSKQN